MTLPKTLAGSSVASLVAGLKAASDETRLRILSLLWQGKSLCVCELEAILRLPHYSISRHLNILKRAGLLVSRREGTFMFYSLAKPLGKGGVVDVILRHVASANGHDAVLQEDAERLQKVVQWNDRGERPTAYCERLSAPPASGRGVRRHSKTWRFLHEARSQVRA